MKGKWARLAAVILLWAAPVATAHAETFLVIVEEFRNGEAAPAPLASQEGLMSAMFDLGHITFETGPYRPQMDWDSLEFGEPLRLTREGRGRYLAAVRVFARQRPRRPGGLPGADPGEPTGAKTSGSSEADQDGPSAAEPGGQARAGTIPLEGLETTVRAVYLLFDAADSALLGRGELTGSSSDAGRDLTYGEFLFATGERLAQAIVSLIPASPAQ